MRLPLVILTFSASCAVLTLPFPAATAHEPSSHHAATYSVDTPRAPDQSRPKLILTIIHNNKPAAARFSLTLDDKQPYLPPFLNSHGIRFTSVHSRKKQTETILYARGSGPVEIPLPENSRTGTVSITKGYEFTPLQLAFEINGPETHLQANLSRHTNLENEGWVAADTHLHYERLDPDHDPDWLTMLDADGLAHGVFMVLKGGNLPGVWAQQYAYGPKGIAHTRSRFLIPGEEFRGPFQGHNNLFGLAQVIEPISLGVKNDYPWHWPSMHDVLLETRRSGGIGGPAHGGTFGKASTAILDAVLRASEFFELANTHLYELDPWYRLLNCGFILPPVAGTDLPNNPFPSPRQPFFGETRTYVRCAETPSYESWRNTIRRGETFITSGPLIELEVDGVGPGGIVKTFGDPDSNVVTVKVKVTRHPSPGSKPANLELIVNGSPLPVKDNSKDELLSLELDRSSWIALRARGPRKNMLWAKTGILQHQIAHTAPIQIIVDDQAITSPSDATSLINELKSQRHTFATQTKYQHESQRAEMLKLFDQAIRILTLQN